MQFISISWVTLGMSTKVYSICIVHYCLLPLILVGMLLNFNASFVNTFHHELWTWDRVIYCELIDLHSPQVNLGLKKVYKSLYTLVLCPLSTWTMSFYSPFTITSFTYSLTLIIFFTLQNLLVKHKVPPYHGMHLQLGACKFHILRVLYYHLT